MAISPLVYALLDGDDKRLTLEFSQCEGIVEIQVGCESLLDGCDEFLHGYSALK